MNRHIRWLLHQHPVGILLGSLLGLASLAPQVWGVAELINGDRTIAGALNYGVSTGTSTAYVLTLDKAIPGYAPGACYLFKAHIANTGAATLNVNGRGVRTLVKFVGGTSQALAANDIGVGQDVQVCDLADGTNMQVMNLGTATGSGTPGGSAGQVQYNSAGSFGGSSGHTASGTELLSSRSRVTAMTTDLTLTTAHGPVLACDASGGPRTATLPTAATTVQGQWLLLKTDSSANACTFARSGSDTLNGATDAVSVTLPWGSADAIVAGTANWSVQAMGATTGGGGTGITPDTALRAAYYNSTTTVDGAPAMTFAGPGTTISSTANRITTVSASKTLDATDGPIIACTGGASDVTLTLPVVATTPSRRWTVIKIDEGAGRCLLLGNGTETLNGGTAPLAAATPRSRLDADLDQTTGTPNWSVVAGKTAFVLPADLTPVPTGAQQVFVTSSTTAGAWRPHTTTLQLPLAACQGTTASLLWDTPPSPATPATAACETGTTISKGVATFPDDATLTLLITFVLPTDFVGPVSGKLVWASSVTTGNVEWGLALACVSEGAVDDPPFNTRATVSDPVQVTANATNVATIASIATTGASTCSAGALAHLRLDRNATAGNAPDTLAGSARLVLVELSWLRQ